MWSVTFPAFAGVMRRVLWRRRKLKYVKCRDKAALQCALRTECSRNNLLAVGFLFPFPRARQMKIAYVTTYDSSDIHAWSGLGSYILKALQDSGQDTHTIKNLREDRPFTSRLRGAFYRRVLHKTYLQDRDPAILMSYARQVEKALEGTDCDVVFSPGTVPIAFLQTKKPVVFWTDATFAGMIDFYPGFSNLCAETVKDGNRMEQAALSNCRLAIYSSDWAAESAKRFYDVDPEKVKVVTFGANIECARTERDINEITAKKSFDVCKLVFVGVDWFRKGGDIALSVAEKLNLRGIKTELHIVGCKPPGSIPSFVVEHGFISKKTEEGRKRFDALMAGSHFMILPSRAECCAVAFAEASSFGLPSVSLKVGGIPSAIHDGRNGRTFSPDESHETWCDYIMKFMSSREEYSAMALSSFAEYSQRLNWTSAGREVANLLSQIRA